ncbi:glycosyltransferase family 2 protein [Periweissella beninensis]|uniref:Glycosyltransferase family 2 protein n=1 Tax=Periweissella beninensis TaxID=504936 RepID=A0ABT0VK50_9LACO|nr:glycosyltransferase family 2 protein [Periweissella beninensis]MBM7543417.1 glycosyltransferase involved in cell wall biosynthesis [Periweissella beninensis]MCM2437289.1 glycosyltransferase family 2 protein [Periweissella beninensis]MCT4396084.1 glycosyltransferase [Periweissella beninensis]
MNELKSLTIVVPVYNEEEVILTSAEIIYQKLMLLIKQNKISQNSEVVFVNDGSKDTTWELVSTLSQRNKQLQGINLSRNFGHQNALLAGLTSVVVTSDFIITIDADLQDDVNLIDQMVDEALAGNEIVYGVRNNRDSDTWFKKHTAETFYRLMAKMGVNIVPNHADYRLMSQRAVQELLKYQETNLFLRGVIPLLGFKTTKVYYTRQERSAGVSKYPLPKMLKFAWDGITSFSVAPIRIILLLGIITVISALLVFSYSLIEHLLGNTTSGWPSLIISIWLIGGIQLISISVIGEYIGKIFNEVKHRPRFTIQENTLEQ